MGASVNRGPSYCFSLSTLPPSGLSNAPLSYRPGKQPAGRNVFATGRLHLGKKLYVGNLTYAVTDSNLEEWFAQYGTVQSAQVITDRETGRSKGFAFVEMDTEAQAQAAIQGLNDQEHGGRRLTVNEAKPRQPRSGGSAGGGYGGSRGRRY
jgi:RNA recognition motif-containing protein